MKKYSQDNEIFREDAPEDALEQIWDSPHRNLKPGDVVTVYGGTVIFSKASSYAPDVAEYMMNNANDEHSEIADGWDFSKEEEDSLQSEVCAVIDAWCDKRDMHPKFGHMVDVHELKYLLKDGFGTFELIFDSSK
ncbi:MAG: hypothetical protein AAFX93_19470 [Verrucomicrobiota bacterium]